MRFLVPRHLSLVASRRNARTLPRDTGGDNVWVVREYTYTSCSMPYSVNTSLSSVTPSRLPAASIETGVGESGPILDR